MNKLTLVTDEQAAAIYAEFDEWVKNFPSWKFALRGDLNSMGKYSICEYIASTRGLTLYKRVSEHEC